MIRSMTFAAWEWGARRKTVHYLNYLEQNQWSSEEKIKKFRDAKFNALIEHVYNNVPYYTKIMKDKGLKPIDFKTIEDIEKFPILTKEIIRTNFDKLKARNFKKYSPKLYQSGGTTGRPLEFFKDKATFEKQLSAAYRAWRWAGWDFGIPYVQLWGSTADLRAEKKLKSKVRDKLTSSRLLLPCFVMNNEILQDYTEKIIKFKPKVLIGYAASIYLLAEYCEAKGINTHITSIITTAETLFEHQRKKFEKVFDAEVFDDYGMRETSVRATECERHQGYHVSIENGIIEITNKGKAIEKGLGKILITDFNNFAFPFIRYENGDVGTATTDKCPCGRGLPIIKSFQGRAHDIFVTKEGEYMPGELFVYIFLDLKGAEYQVHQKKAGEITLNIVKQKDFNQDSLKKCLEHLKQYVPKQKIDVHYVKKIKVPASGKRRFTISEVELKF